jgi:ubiquinone/menaquinone biosynthesis C-methylase UbiE
VTQTPEIQTLVLPDGEKHKQGVSAVFNTVASGYDDPALRFFPFCADHIVSQLQPSRGWKILDVATGTGVLAGALAHAISPDGRVIAIDLSEGMLARAEKNIKRMALDNVEFLQMDAEEPEFKNDYFNAVTCSFGLFFIPDMLKALKHWQRVTRTGGTVLFSSFTDNAFDPLMNIFIEDLEKFGLDVSEKMVGGARLRDADVCRNLMVEAGYLEIEQNVIQVGYHLRETEEWWSAVWNTAMRGLVEQLPQETQSDFKNAHLKRVAELKTKDGLWMDVEVRLTSGTVPSS